MQLVKVDSDKVVQFVVDGFEQIIYSSIDPSVKKITFSGKKQKHTFTKLLFITTNGWVCNLSHSYPGSLNDLNLTLFPESLKILQHLDNDCIIIGDKGFRGRKEVHIETIDRIHQENESKFLQVRSCVENVINKGRKWRIMDDRQRKHVKNMQQAAELHHKQTSVIFCLVNLFDIPIRSY